MTPDTSIKKHLSATGALFHRQSRGLDVVRNPYKAWILSCLLFLLLLLGAIGLDSWVAFKFKDGGFAPAVSATPAPAPIIDKNLLIKTAGLYSDKAAAMILLESSTPPVADPAGN